MVDLAMYVKKMPYNGRVMLTYSKSVRKNGKPTSTVVQKLGYLDELEKQYDDPIGHFQAEAKRLNDEEKAVKESICSFAHFKNRYVKGDKNSIEHAKSVISYGVAPLSYVYHMLEIDRFMDNRRHKTKFECNLNSIWKCLVFGRILIPGSKLATWRVRERLGQDCDFTDDDVYRSLSFFAKYKDDLIHKINVSLENSGLRTSNTFAYYDVTNYYWEIDNADEDKVLKNGEIVEGWRKRGCSKEHRPEPIVQMGLMMDQDGIPINYGLFPGNNNDVTTFRPMVEQTKSMYASDHVIYVADKGLMSGDNISSLILEHNGFVISRSARTLPKEDEKWMFDNAGWEYEYDKKEPKKLIAKTKSRVIARDFDVKDINGKTKKVTLNIRQVTHWSLKYQERTRQERQETINKAMANAKRNKKNGALNTHGANKYLKKTIFGDAGEEVQNPEFTIEIDMEKIAEEEKYDGYYMVFSNVFGDPQQKGVRFDGKTGSLYLPQSVTDKDIMEIYKGLWRIERCFRITKSELKARPVFVHEKESIEAHFLSCYVALVILKVLEKLTDYEIEIETMVKALREANVTASKNKESTLSMVDCTNVVELIGLKLGISLTREEYTKEEFKKLMADYKKAGRERLKTGIRST